MTFTFRTARTLGAVTAIVLALTMHLATAQPAPGGQRVVYEGTVAVAVEDDFARGRATMRYFLDERNLGSRFELKVNENQGRKLKTGQQVRVRGNAAGTTLNADTGDDGVTVVAEPQAAAPVAARKAVVIIVDIKDSSGTVHTVSPDCDGAVAKSADIMFGSQTGAANLDGCYQDASFGALGFGGSVFPGGTLDVTRVTVNEATTIGGACNYSAWASAADKAVAGVTLGNYQHRVYVLPANVGCSWAGLAYVSCGSSCQAWVKAYSNHACGYPDAYVHEIGHNLGLLHASTDTNNDGTLDCEYCDTSSFMGYATGAMRTLNGPHKVQMGWASGARLVDGSQGGTFTVSSLALAQAGSPQVVKVVPNGGAPYYISFRTVAGYDKATPASYLNKLNVHRWSGSGNSRYITALANGQSFADTATGVSIQQLSSTADSATFTVSTVCAAQAPTVTISPSSQGAGASLPATRSYTVTVTNRDSAACSTSTFALSSTLPTSFTGGFAAPATLTLAPGASGSAALSVTAPAGTQQGSHTLSAGTSADGSHGSASASATFWVDMTKPSTPTGLKASVKGTKVTLSWTASTDGGGSGVARYEIRRNTATAGTSASTTYADSPGSGTFTYTVLAVDGAGNLSDASGGVTVSVGGKTARSK